MSGWSYACRRWYLAGVIRVTAMTLRLDETETARLRDVAAAEGRSMQDVAKTAIHQYVTNRATRLQSAIKRVRDEDAELLRRLGE